VGKKRIYAGALAACLAVPAVAFGGGVVSDPDYGGKVEGDPNTYFGFDVVKRNGVKRIKRMFVVNIPFGCPDAEQDGRQTGDLEGAIKVRADGRFAKTRSYNFGDMRGNATGIKYTVRGRLRGDRARGTFNIRLRGSGCYSGTLRFRAKKPAPEAPKPFPIPIRVGG
jgi:hypothetical protein